MIFVDCNPKIQTYLQAAIAAGWITIVVLKISFIVFLLLSKYFIGFAGKRGMNRADSWAIGILVAALIVLSVLYAGYVLFLDDVTFE